MACAVGFASWRSTVPKPTTSSFRWLAPQACTGCGSCSVLRRERNRQRSLLTPLFGEALGLHDATTPRRRKAHREHQEHQETRRRVATFDRLSRWRHAGPSGRRAGVRTGVDHKQHCEGPVACDPPRSSLPLPREARLRQRLKSVEESLRSSLYSFSSSCFFVTAGRQARV